MQKKNFLAPDWRTGNFSKKVTISAECVFTSIKRQNLKVFDIDKLYIDKLDIDKYDIESCKEKEPSLFFIDSPGKTLISS